MFLLDSGYSPEAAEKKAQELKPHLVKFLKDAIAFTEQVVYVDTNPQQ